MADLIAYAQFVASKAGKTGIAPTVDVHRVTRATGAASQIVTGGSAAEIGRGVYSYLLAGADPTLYDYVFAFITADATVDQQQIPALWTSYSLAYATELARLDAAISTRLASSGYTAPLSALQTAAAILDALAASYDDPGTIGEAINNGSATPGDFWQYVGPGGRTLTTTPAEAQSLTLGERVVYKYTTIIVTMTGLGNISDRTALWITAKRQPGDADIDALFQVEENLGLVYIGGAEAETPTDGLITVSDQVDGDIVLRLEAAAASLVPIVERARIDVKVLRSGGDVDEISQDYLHIRPAVTHAIDVVS